MNNAEHTAVGTTNEGWGNYTEIGEDRRQQYGIVDIANDRKIAIAEIHEDGRTRVLLGLRQGDSARDGYNPDFLHAYAEAIAEAVNGQENFNADMALERKREEEREAVRKEIAERIESKRILLNAQLNDALDAGNLEDAEDLMVTLAGLGDRNAMKCLEELTEAGA